MAYNRPKSLDELNSIFDKTIAAEKAIKKNSSKLENGEEEFSSFSPDAAELPAEEHVPEAPSESIDGSVSDFIASFSAEPEPVKAKPQMTVLTPEAPAKPEEKTVEDYAAAFGREEKPEPAAPQTPAVKADRDELFKDYARIMSDEDDDAFSEKKLSRKEKKLLRKKQKEEKKAARKHEEESAATDDTDYNVPDFDADIGTDTPAFDDDAGTVTPAFDDDAGIETPAFDDDAGIETPAFDDDAGIETPAFDDDDANDDNDFDFPEDHIPEWMKEEEKYEEIEDPTAEKSKVLRILLNTVLSLVLVAVISIGALATVFKTVVAVNTGKLISDRYYVFTTYKSYDDLGLSKGDLVITEKKFAEDGEVFAYVDYSSRSFEFGKRTDSITKDDGDVLYVTEKDGGRALVSRDDCKGVVYRTYAGRGNVVSFLTDNYIILVSAAVVISLAVVLVFALALRTKKYDEEEDEEEERDKEFEDIFSTIE